MMIKMLYLHNLWWLNIQTSPWIAAYVALFQFWYARTVTLLHPSQFTSGHMFNYWPAESARSPMFLLFALVDFETVQPPCFWAKHPCVGVEKFMCMFACTFSACVYVCVCVLRVCMCVFRVCVFRICVFRVCVCVCVCVCLCSCVHVCIHVCACICVSLCTNYEVYIPVSVGRQKIWSDVIGIKCSWVHSVKINEHKHMHVITCIFSKLTHRLSEGHLTSPLSSSC